MVDERVEQLGTGRFGAFLAVGVADVLELATFVLQFEVIPVLATDEHAGVAVLELQVMDALEDLGEGFALLEVQVAIVGCLRQALAAVVHPDQVLVGVGRRPAGADGERRVELAFDFTNVETDSESRTCERGSKADGQGQLGPAPEQVCRFHRRYSMYFFVMAVSPFKNGPSDRFAGLRPRRHGLRMSPPPFLKIPWPRL
ncbi:hypothetical protein D3C79_615300 [compost metagenome]